MTLTYDKDADSLEILLRGALVARTEQIDAGTLVDVDEHGSAVAIEVIRPARRWPLEEILERFDITTEDAEMLRAIWDGKKTYPFTDAAATTGSDLIPA